MRMKETLYYNVIIFALVGITVNQAHKWSYSGNEGPSYWHEMFPEACSGKHQSPIDIKPEETIYNPNLKDFAIWYDPPKPDSRMYIKNNGHTVQVDLEGDFYVTNGGLYHEYKAFQFHFHWGHKEHHGSEHRVDGIASPLEMHLVTYNEELYSDIAKAVVMEGGLAVLGTMYKISEEDNPTIDTIVRALKHIRDPDFHDKVALPQMSLRDFLPKDISSYYRYNGSLTTPSCFESVIWTVFEDTQTISLSQLKEFTKLLQNKHHRKGFKPVEQSGNNRHRRSLNRAERKLERNAEHVLDELGIRGDEYQESVLKSELKYMQMINNMQQDDNADTEDETEDTHKIYNEDNDDSKFNDEDKKDEANNKYEVTVEYNEEDATKNRKTSDENAEDDNIKDIKSDEEKDVEHVDNHNENSNEEIVKEEDTHTSSHKTEYQVETETEDDTFLQEAIVNNFRPVQPLNDRVVYRNFKLRPPINIVDHAPTHSHHAQSRQEDSEDDGSTYHKLSLSAIVVVLIVTVVFV